MWSKPPGLQYFVTAALGKEFMTLHKRPSVSWAPPPGIPAGGLDMGIAQPRGAHQACSPVRPPRAPHRHPLVHGSPRHGRWQSPFRRAGGVVWAWLHRRLLRASMLPLQARPTCSAQGVILRTMRESEPCTGWAIPPGLGLCGRANPNFSQSTWHFWVLLYEKVSSFTATEQIELWLHFTVHRGSFMYS